jgi:ribosomal protein S18 acetylase RimI-like enzyme
MTEVTVRRGGPADVDLLLALFDEAIAWMVARDQPGQWGTAPMSARDGGRDRVRALCAGGGLRVARLDGEDVAALVVSDRPPPHVPGVDEPELYIDLLLVSRRRAGRRIGEALVATALAEARERGVGVVRVDCWAGAPSLVAWYEARGFRRAGTFEVNDGWRGQIFSMELARV